MSNNTIVNGAPLVRSLGIQDNSKRAPVVEPESLPTHLAKVYTYAAKGPTTPQLVVGNAAVQMYGSDTFDEYKEFATHQTPLINILSAAANPQMIERVLPSDVGPKSNFLLSLDVLPMAVPNYARDINGDYILNGSTGLPTVGNPATLTGFKVKWVMTSVTSKLPTDTDSDLFGNAVTTVGDQTANAVQSQRYPIVEFWASSEGKYFNNTGLRIWAPVDTSADAVNASIVSGNKAYPFRLAAINRLTSSSSASITTNQSGEPSIEFVLKPGQLNAATRAKISLKDNYLASYQNLTDTRFAPQFADMGNFHIYQSNIDTLLDTFYAAENVHTGAGSDFTPGATDEKYLFNLFGGTSSMNAPYYTYVFNTSDANATRLTAGTNLYAKGGSDGTMSETLFAGLVSTAVSNYADENSQLQNDARYPEAYIYDTGFPIATKFDLIKFISVRKDTAVILSTYQVDGVPLTGAEDNSVAIALRTRALSYPESEFFGTPTCRALIMGRSGILRNSTYTKRLPITLELAAKAAKMMGAGNGIWDSTALFDRSPGNILTMFDDVSVPFTPAKQRNKDWDAGLNYAADFTRGALYFPALKTVYTDDTSVLNSFFTMAACIELEKVGQRVHREFSGATDLTDAQLVEQVNKSVERKTVGRFANLFKVIPAAYLTASDTQRGFTYTLPINLYANVSKTVMTLSVVARRLSDLALAA
jgi:hypothetical protein